MSTLQRLVKWLVPFLAVVAVGIAWRTARRESEMTRAVESAKALRGELYRQIAQAEARLTLAGKAAGKEHSPTVNPESQRTPVAAPGAALSTAVTSTMRISEIDPQTIAAVDPKIRALHLRAFAEDLDGIWGPLLKQLNLPPDKLERFKALLITHEERRLDVTAVASEQNLSLSDPAIQKMRRTDGTILSREMRALLGPDLMAIYQPYRSSLELRPIVAEVVAATYFTSGPLTFEQSQRLTEILSANSEKRANGFVRAGTIKWDTALAQITASGTFSPAVIDSLQRLVAQRTADGKLSDRWNEVVRKHVGSNPTPPGLWVPGISLRH
jgi:hypothetical protein